MMSKGMSFLSFYQSHWRSLTPNQSLPAFWKEKPRSFSTMGSKAIVPRNAEEMKWVFDKFDTNGDGRISKEEYKLAQRNLDNEMTEKEMEKSFEVMDSDGDGYVDFREFREVYNHGGGVTAADIKNAFKLFDLDGDGKISAEELMVILGRLGERHSLKACKQMVRGVDRDGDGLIDISEFMNMMIISTNINMLWPY